jgi:phosphoribosylformimino-5-aminoimidazole carboxamide ribotide isomerase
MDVIPAIDLRGGRCVRLRQGDFDRETVFADDPVAVASKWQAEGATRLHLVDLDGAKNGRSIQLEAIAAIVHGVGIPCQLGGGLRDSASVESVLSLGIERVVIGTMALREPNWFRSLTCRFPGRVALAIDAHEGMVATDGWLDVSRISALALAKQYEELPLAALIYTDIARDGMLNGPNLHATTEMVRHSGLPVIASGGVGSLADLRDLALTNVTACIVGRALYDQRFALSEAIQTAKANSASRPGV